VFLCSADLIVLMGTYFGHSDSNALLPVYLHQHIEKIAQQCWLHNQPSAVEVRTSGRLQFRQATGK